MKRLIASVAAALLLGTAYTQGSGMTGNVTAESTYTATFRVAEPKNISPAGSADADMPDMNDWGFNSWIFMEVSA